MEKKRWGSKVGEQWWESGDEESMVGGHCEAEIPENPVQTTRLGRMVLRCVGDPAHRRWVELEYVRRPPIMHEVGPGPFWFPSPYSP